MESSQEDSQISASLMDNREHSKISTEVGNANISETKTAHFNDTSRVIDDVELKTMTVTPAQTIATTTDVDSASTRFDASKPRVYCLFGCPTLSQSFSDHGRSQEFFSLQAPRSRRRWRKGERVYRLYRMGPLPILGSLEERRKLPQQNPGRIEPRPKTGFGAFGAWKNMHNWMATNLIFWSFCAATHI